MKFITVKMIGTHGFLLYLKVNPGQNKYVVAYEIGLDYSQSEPMSDYKMASYLFDLKLKELENGQRPR